MIFFTKNSKRLLVVAAAFFMIACFKRDPNLEKAHNIIVENATWIKNQCADNLIAFHDKYLTNIYYKIVCHKNNGNKEWDEFFLKTAIDNDWQLINKTSIDNGFYLCYKKDNISLVKYDEKDNKTIFMFVYYASRCEGRS